MDLNRVLRTQVDDLAEEQRVFRELCEDMALLICQHGIECLPYRSKDLPYFSALSAEQRRFAISELSSYLKLCRDVIASGESLSSSPSFTWRAIREAALIPPSDLFTLIEATDIVEMYDLANIQKFRNFRFFEFCSYTLEDLYSRSWPELFRRIDEEITSKIIALITKLIANHDKRIHLTGIGPQLIEEVGSLRRYVNQLDVKYLGLLYDQNNRPSRFIVIEKAEKISRA